MKVTFLLEAKMLELAFEPIKNVSEGIEESLSKHSCIRQQSPCGMANDIIYSRCRERLCGVEPTTHCAMV
jgi:hypothetical protein